MKASLLGAAVAAVAPLDLLGGTKGRPKKGGAELKISLQEGVTPGETLKEKLDFMENHGVVGLEPNGAGLAGRVGELKEALRGREVKISAICAGFGGFILSEEQAVRDEFDRTMREIIAAAGELGSTGVIMVPAFNSQVPVMPHTQSTRDYLIERLRLLGDYARQCGTTVILEPLNRKEAFYLRQVADAASICRDAKNEGVKCMGDFWHMTSEDPSDSGAGLVDVRAAKNIEALNACGQRNRASDNSTGSLAGINDFKSRLIDQFVIKCLEANTNTLALHYLSFKERGAEAIFGPRFEMS